MTVPVVHYQKRPDILPTTTCGFSIHDRSHITRAAHMVTCQRCLRWLVRHSPEKLYQRDINHTKGEGLEGIDGQ